MYFGTLNSTRINQYGEPEVLNQQRGWVKASPKPGSAIVYELVYRTAYRLLKKRGLRDREADASAFAIAKRNYELTRTRF